MSGKGIVVKGVCYGGPMDGRELNATVDTFRVVVAGGKDLAYILKKYAGLVDGPTRRIESAFAWVLDGEEPSAEKVMADARERGLTKLTDYPEHL